MHALAQPLFTTRAETRSEERPPNNEAEEEEEEEEEEETEAVDVKEGEDATEEAPRTAWLTETGAAQKALRVNVAATAQAGDRETTTPKSKAASVDAFFTPLARPPTRKPRGSID